SVCVTEIPLLFESGAEGRFDKIVVITAPEDERHSRSRADADKRERRFLPDEEKIARADYAYANTGTLTELDRFVGSVMDVLTRGAAWPLPPRSPFWCSPGGRCG